jgi:hypothetical protein
VPAVPAVPAVPEVSRIKVLQVASTVQARVISVTLLQNKTKKKRTCKWHNKILFSKDKKKLN